jgi:hypothetical protein
VGEKVVRQHATETARRTTASPGGPVVAGLDGGYVRSRQRQEERHFEVIAGKMIDAASTQHRFAFARNGQATSADAFAQALAAAGVHADTPATVLCDGDAGLWRLQREALPGATVALHWWHVAIRLEHAPQTARGLGAGVQRTLSAPERRQYLKEIRGDISYFRRSYAKATMFVNISGLDIEDSARKIKGELDALSEISR